MNDGLTISLLYLFAAFWGMNVFYVAKLPWMAVQGPAWQRLLACLPLVAGVSLAVAYPVHQQIWWNADPMQVVLTHEVVVPALCAAIVVLVWAFMRRIPTSLNLLLIAAFWGATLAGGFVSLSDVVTRIGWVVSLALVSALLGAGAMLTLHTTIRGLLRLRSVQRRRVLALAGTPIAAIPGSENPLVFYALSSLDEDMRTHKQGMMTGRGNEDGERFAAPFPINNTMLSTQESYEGRFWDVSAHLYVNAIHALCTLIFVIAIGYASSSVLMTMSQWLLPEGSAYLWGLPIAFGVFGILAGHRLESGKLSLGALSKGQWCVLSLVLVTILAMASQNLISLFVLPLFWGAYFGGARISGFSHQQNWLRLVVSNCVWFVSAFGLAYLLAIGLAKLA